MRIFANRTIDRAGKIILVAVTGLYGLGLLIENIHLTRCGIADLTFVSARYVFVGAAFLIYVFISFVLITIPYAILIYLKSIPLLVRIPLAIVATLQASFMITVPFSYFVVTVVTPPQLFFNVWALNRGFWEIYRPYYFAYGSLAAYILGLIIRTIKVHLPPFIVPSLIVPALLGLGMIAPMWLIIPYTWVVFPNIDFSVGGAQPPVVSIMTKNDLHASLLSADAEASVAADKNRFLLWHKDNAFLYLGATDTNRDPFLIRAIPINEVTDLQFQNSIAIFDVATRVTRHPRLEALLVRGEYRRDVR